MPAATIKELVDSLVAFIGGDGSTTYATGISFAPPVDIFIPEVGQPQRLVPLSKVDQKKFLELLGKHKDIGPSVRQLLAAA